MNKSMQMADAATDTSSQEFFESKYRASVDPWHFASSEYELCRYEATMQALGGERFERCFEPGCSIGVLTERLAQVCAWVEAVDLSPSAVERARGRCAGITNVRVSCGGLAEVLLAEDCANFDLVVLSEIGYYFEVSELTRLAGELVGRITPGGVLLAAHWLGHSADHRLSGDEVHAVLGGMEGMLLERAERYEGFRLDRWRRAR